MYLDVSGHVKFWHFPSHKCLYTLNDDHAQTLSMAFAADGATFTTVGADPKLFVYDLETKRRISEHEATYVCYVC